MELSKRLRVIASFVEKGAVLADVGTDHGYVHIDLVQRGIVSRAIAMDVKEGPLQRAREHIREYGLTEQIETRLGDGLSRLAPGEADTILIAGMGGPLICRILEAGMETARAASSLILSPQSEVGEVRRFLCRFGFRIGDEAMVKDEGKYYVVIKASPVTEERQAGNGGYREAGGEAECQAGLGRTECRDSWDEADWRYGRRLLEQRNPVLLEFLELEKKKYRAIAQQLGDPVCASPARAARTAEVAEALAAISRAQQWWE